MKRLFKLNTRYLGVNFARFGTSIGRSYTWQRGWGVCPTVCSIHYGRYTLAFRFGRI